VGEYLLLRWLAAVGLFLIPFAFRMPWYLDLIFAIIGFYIPKVWVGQREKDRVKKIEDQLVDALTMMANSLRAGSSFLQAMEMVSKELPPPISQEFAQVLAEVSVGAPVDESLTDMSRRVRSYDVYLIITAMTIQRQVGGNLSEVLNNIAHTIRERQRLLRQVQVETAEQRVSAYILLALPVFMLFIISILNRTYIDTLLEPGVGRILLALALVLQIFGYFVMRRIADVKV
jgi:tight adherence protein B